MNEPANPAKPPLSKWKIALAVAIGLAVPLYLIITTFKPNSLRGITFSSRLAAGLLLAVLTVLIRDVAFMYKLRLSTGNKLTWSRTLQAIIMWEFGACVTPKLAEVPFTLFVLKKAGISYGRSTAVLMLNSFLDNLAFVLLFTGLFLLTGNRMFPPQQGCESLQGHTILQGFYRLAADHRVWVAYFVLLGFSIFLCTAIFILPHTTRKFFHALSRWRLFKFAQAGLYNLGTEVETTALEFRSRPAAFWLKMCSATVINWMARYALANALIFGFTAAPLPMLEVYARQYVVWLFIVVPSAPGSSGVAESAFMALNCHYLPGDLAFATTVTFVWRLFSFYLYLLLGMLVWPSWSRRVIAE